MLPDTITTKRLLLRPHQLKDVDQVFAFAKRRELVMLRHGNLLVVAPAN